jgi:hypothetical protein
VPGSFISREKPSVLCRQTFSRIKNLSAAVGELFPPKKTRRHVSARFFSRKKSDGKVFRLFSEKKNMPANGKPAEALTMQLGWPAKHAKKTRKTE